jgi:preprotein translocase subunit YajC
VCGAESIGAALLSGSVEIDSSLLELVFGWIITMNDLFLYVPIVFAQDANGGSGWSTFLLLAPIVPLFYFLFIRPQQQAENKRRSMLDTLKKNDKVLTTGGIYATVVSIDATHDKVILRVDDERGVKLAFTRASIARVLDSSSEKSPERAAEST